jgi:glycosyltransferase involved in cell wall biosynthesis
VIKALAEVRKSIPEARLIIAGDGPGRPELESLTARMNLGEAVEFMGVVKIDRLVELLNQCHLFLNASAKEGWGLTVVEANACGMPVIASNRPGLMDSVKHEQTGYLVEYGRPEAFAARAVELLSDQAKWQAMSAASLDWARSLTWDRTADEMEQIFLEEVS